MNVFFLVTSALFSSTVKRIDLVLYNSVVCSDYIVPVGHIWKFDLERNKKKHLI